MASPTKAADSSSGQPKRSDGEQGISNLSSELSPPKKQIQETSVEAKLKENTEKLKGHTMQLFDSAAVAKVAPGSSSSRPVPVNMLALRMKSPLCVLNGLDVSNGSMEKVPIHVQEENLSAGTVVFKSKGRSKAEVPLIKLPLVNRLPPYTTWISLDR